MTSARATPPPEVILDSTLRDGEQAAGVALTPNEKAEYVRRAEAIGIRYIEVGFPQNSLDFDACRAAAGAARIARIVAMALTTPESVASARQVGAHEVLLVVPCSESHFGHVYGGGFEQLCNQLSKSIKTARAMGLEINVGLEDASQRDGALLSRILRALRPHLPDIASLTIADTRGQLLGPEVEALIEDVRNQLTETRPLAFHAHNDLGLAVANSVAALSMRPPVECVQLTMCGIGERAGNASLEQVAVLLETKLARKTGINLTGLIGLARFVEDIFLTPLHPHQPIVGSKVFLHESGLHQKGMLRDDTTYQFLDPARFASESDLILGKHSGKWLRRQLAIDAGCTEDEVLALQTELATSDKRARRAAVKKLLEELRQTAFIGVGRREAVRLLKRRHKPQTGSRGVVRSRRSRIG